MRISLVKYFIGAMMIALPFAGFSQGIGDVTVISDANYDPVIKEAVKQTDRPEIIDTVKKINKVTYTSPAKQFATNYKVSPIEPAKMVNEPLSKLYQMLIKAGVGIIYPTPYAEVFYNNLRSKDIAWGIRYKYLSSFAKFDTMGHTDFSDNEAGIYAKKFLRKHTLSGDFNYNRNMVHYYGFSDKQFPNVNSNDYKQVFQLFEAKGRLQSHYADTSKDINHDIHLNYYNFGDISRTFENNVFADGLMKARAGDTKINAWASVDFYNVTSAHDTINNVIGRFNAFFEEGNGSKWKLDAGIGTAIDYSDFKGTKYYFYPRFNVYYNIYQNLVIPYAGVSGGLDKNSFRSMATTNPFVLSELQYKNTNNKYNLYGGLRGALSSNTSYDIKALYGRYENMAYFLADYNTYPENKLANKYKVVYMNTNYLNISGQIKYQLKEKINISAKGNFYSYKLDSSGAYPWHKPNFDITFSGNYNLKSKIIIKADIYVIGKQWALQKDIVNSAAVYTPKQLNGITDMNIGIEYRYTKLLSAFVNFNNIGNFRYYRWDKYPTQKFNAMIGLTFVPF
jgi:hypothetical protein